MWHRPCHAHACTQTAALCIRQPSSAAATASQPQPETQPQPQPQPEPEPQPHPSSLQGDHLLFGNEGAGAPEHVHQFLVQPPVSREWLSDGATQLTTPASSYGPGGWGCSRLSTQEKSLSRSLAHARMHSCVCMCMCLCMLMSCCHRERVPELETPHRPRPGAEARRGA